MPKFVKNRASGQSHPVAEGGLSAIHRHLYAGEHHLLLPACKTTCSQKVPLCYKDITSKHIFTSRGRGKQISHGLLGMAICFRTSPHYTWVLHVELSPDCFQDKSCVETSIFALNHFLHFYGVLFHWKGLWLWLKVVFQNIFSNNCVFAILLTVSICAQCVWISISCVFMCKTVNYVC